MKLALTIYAVLVMLAITAVAAASLSPALTTAKTEAPQHGEFRFFTVQAGNDFVPCVSLVKKQGIALSCDWSQRETAHPNIEGGGNK